MKDAWGLNKLPSKSFNIFWSSVTQARIRHFFCFVVEKNEKVSVPYATDRVKIAAGPFSFPAFRKRGAPP
jgi:hypothetical protein